MVIGDPVLAHEVMQISDTADKGWMYQPFEVCAERDAAATPASQAHDAPEQATWHS